MDAGLTEDLVVSFSPIANPLHDRFDRESYVHLYENATQGRARMEFINHAGTIDQDLTMGYLDRVKMKYSFKHPTLISFEMGGNYAQEWHLPAYDLKNDHRYLYKVHTIDTYFWTKEDALQLVDSMRRVLSPHQLTILDEPVFPPPNFGSYVDSVVQTLEDLTLHSVTNESKPSEKPLSMLQRPPVSATPCPYYEPSFTPLAYNPASPPAPEKFSRGEKTPPNDDGGSIDSKSPPLIVISGQTIDSAGKMKNAPRWQKLLWDDQSAVTELKRDSVSMSRLESSQSIRDASSSIHTQLALSTASHDQPKTAAEDSIHAQLKFSRSPTSPYYLNRHSSPCFTCSSSSSPSYTNQHKASSSLETTLTNCEVITPSTSYPSSPGTPPLMYMSSRPQMDFSVEAVSNNFSKSLYTHGPPPLSIEQQLNYMGPPRIFRVAEFDVAPKPSKPLKTPLIPSFARFEGQAAKLERGMGNLFKKLERRIG